MRLRQGEALDIETAAYRAIDPPFDPTLPLTAGRVAERDGELLWVFDTRTRGSGVTVRPMTRNALNRSVSSAC